MNNTSTFIIVGVVILLIGGAIAFYRYRKANLEQLFVQVHETSKQVPNKKRNSFVLLMFRESLLASKNKKKSPTGALGNKLNNPKLLEVQLVQMTRVLKDSTKVKDKTLKRALHLYNSYQTWEKDRRNNNK